MAHQKKLYSVYTSRGFRQLIKVVQSGTCIGCTDNLQQIPAGGQWEMAQMGMYHYWGTLSFPWTSNCLHRWMQGFVGRVWAIPDLQEFTTSVHTSSWVDHWYYKKSRQIHEQEYPHPKYSMYSISIAKLTSLCLEIVMCVQYDRHTIKYGYTQYLHRYH